MKFLAIFDAAWKDMDKIIEKYRRRIETRSAIKDLFGPMQIIGEPKGFTIFETDDPDVIIKMVLDYAPEMKIKVYPIEESSRFMELWQKMKK